MDRGNVSIEGEMVMPLLEAALADFLIAVEPLAEMGEPGGWLDGLVNLNRYAKDLGASAREAESDDLLCAAERLMPVLAHIDPQVAGEAALTCGVFMEYGLPPRVVGPALLEHFQRTLGLLKAFQEQVRQEIPEANDAVQEEPGGYWVDDRYVTRELAQKFWRRDRRLPQAHAALRNSYLPVVAALSRDREFLREAQQNGPLLSLVADLNIIFVNVLLRLLMDETILVLHPDTAKGFLVFIDGITDNFQLHTLLADALITEGGLLWREGPAWGIPGKRPSARVAATMRGDGPRSIAESSTGSWNLYHWTALDASGCLPSKMEAEHWIWNEGVPADIRPFENRRIILLGPPSYPRGWNTARAIPSLKPTLEVRQVLEEQAVRDWLQRLVAARGKQNNAE
jgi:hypothetical protein